MRTLDELLRDDVVDDVKSVPRNRRLRAVFETLQGLNVHELAAARVLIRRLERSAQNNFFNISRPLRHLRRYVSMEPAYFARLHDTRPTVLDFGCGSRNALSLSILLHLNGAAKVYCYEPGRLQAAQSGLAARELLCSLIRSPEIAEFSQIGCDEIRQRATALLCGGPGNAIELLRSREELESLFGQIDLVLSNHVFEHVDDLPAELRFLLRLSSPRALQLHRVDYRDHRCFKNGKKKTGPLHFYVDGNLTTCNGLRCSDVEQQFRESGFDFRVVKRIEIARDKLPTVENERFKDYPEEILRVSETDYVLRCADGP